MKSLILFCLQKLAISFYQWASHQTETRSHTKFFVANCSFRIHPFILHKKKNLSCYKYIIHQQCGECVLAGLWAKLLLFNIKQVRTCVMLIDIVINDVSKKIFICLFIQLLTPLLAQSTAQGHLGAFHKCKFSTQVEYNTKHAHYMNVKLKHTNIIRKVIPSVLLL